MEKFSEWLGRKLSEAMFTYVLHRPNGEIEVTVQGTYNPPGRGSRDSLGVPQEPDEQEEFEIDSVVDQYGNEIEVTDEEHQELVQAFFHQGQEV